MWGKPAPVQQAGILRTLESFGFKWAGEVWVQSRHDHAALVRATLRRLVYPCACSRRNCSDGEGENRRTVAHSIEDLPRWSFLKQGCAGVARLRVPVAD